MSEIEPAKEKDTIEVIKVEFKHTYDTVLTGHDSHIRSGDYYSMVYPSGLEIALFQRDEDGSWGHWGYDFKTDKKSWVTVDIPERPRVKTIIVDGQFTEMGILIDNWLETHENTDSDECREFVSAGLKNFLERTGQM
jgi:hypothetical protein